MTWAQTHEVEGEPWLPWLNSCLLSSISVVLLQQQKFQVNLLSVKLISRCLLSDCGLTRIGLEMKWGIWMAHHLKTLLSIRHWPCTADHQALESCLFMIQSEHQWSCWLRRQDVLVFPVLGLRSHLWGWRWYVPCSACSRKCSPLDKHSDWEIGTFFFFF